jgi:hypothetical protein
MKDFSFLKKNRIPFGYKYGEVSENDKNWEKKVENISNYIKICGLINFDKN